MPKYLPFLAVFAGCTINVPDKIDIDGVETEDGDGVTLEPFARVDNGTGATLVLVGFDEWAFGTHLWGAACDPEVMKEIDVRVDADWLVISGDPQKRVDCKIKILMQDDVDAVESNGDGDVEGEGDVKGVKTLTVNGNGEVDLGTVETDTLLLSVGGSGAVSIANLQADLLDLDLRGAGNVTLGGDVADGTFDITGNGDLDAKSLTVQNLWIEMHGNGDASVTVEGTIDGEVTGNGTLDVYGSPDGEVEVHGSGEVVSHD